jgi:hypothetical protein
MTFVDCPVDISLLWHAQHFAHLLITSDNPQQQEREYEGYNHGALVAIRTADGRKSAESVSTSSEPRWGISETAVPQHSDRPQQYRAR